MTILKVCKINYIKSSLLNTPDISSDAVAIAEKPYGNSNRADD